MQIGILRMGFCNGNATAAVEEYWLRYPRQWIPNRHVFTSICEKMIPLQVWTAVLNVKYSEMQRKIKTLLTWYSEVHARVLEKFLPASVFCASESSKRYTQKGCIHTTSSAFRILNVRTCVARWNCAVGLILTPIWFVTFCSPTRPILPVMESTIQETPIYGMVIIHMELMKATTNIAFLKCVVWCH